MTARLLRIAVARFTYEKVENCAPDTGHSEETA
jgi:hypothetical protein